MRSFTNFCIKFLFLIAMLYCGKAQSQVEQGEEGAVYWGQCLENFRTSLALSPDDFLLFYRFEEIKLDTLRAQFMRDMRTCKTASSAMDEMMKSKQSQITDLYGLFEKVNAEYPSSVDQYRKSNAHRFMALCDTSGCANTGFEDGTLNGWNAYYGYNSNAGSFNFFNVTNITGGPAGPVTEAANDVLTSTSGFYSWGIGVNPSPDYQISIVSGSRSDALIPSLPVVSPYGGKYSVMLGDSTLVNYGTAILSKTFLVTPNNTDFIYQYAIVLENPNAHTYYEQPFFQVALLDQNGDTITNCGKYSVVSSGGRSQGFKSVFVPANGPLGNDSAYYRDWTVVCVPLRNYIGQCVTIIFEAGDCSRSSHFGYAYVDASCAPLEIIPSSPSFCGQKTITLTGPPGFTIYQWSGPGIVGPTNTQSIAINTVGKYQLIAVPVTGVACDDTLTINVTDTTGHPTEPSFTASAACAGGVMQFTNTSVPLTGPGVKFYWDFYNLGIHQDSAVNPTWIFNAPGVYYVRLYEQIDGCGTDTLMPVTVYPAPVVSITAPPKICNGDTITLTASVTSSYSPLCTYSWNTGADTKSITVIPSASDTEYYVTVTSGCTDTIFHKISLIYTNPIHVCCDTTMPAGDTTTILAYGEQSYVWIPTNGLACPTCPSTMAEPLQSTTYTVTGTDSNGCKLRDTVQIIITRCSDVFIPKAFTPNHNGLNDTFYPQGKCLSSYSMYIFDRWGVLIYFSPTGQPWDGTYRGRRVQEDTYVYQIVANTWDGNQQTLVGAVTVLR